MEKAKKKKRTRAELVKVNSEEARQKPRQCDMLRKVRIR